MYLIFLAGCYALAYPLLAHLFAYFFADERPRFGRRPLFSIALVLALAGVTFLIATFALSGEWGDRALHVFGGGAIAYLLCFLVARDGGLKLPKLKFFIFSALVVTALGVCNELMEFLLQSLGVIVSASTVTDTWLDLLSNAIGILLAAACLAPFSPHEAEQDGPAEIA